MSTTPIISTGPDKSQDVQNGSTAGAKTRKAGDSVDPTFGLLLGQLFASVLQNGQQTPLDATQPGEDTDSGGKPAGQLQTQSTAQQPADIANQLPGVQNQDKTTDAKDTLAAQFSELLKNIKGNADDQDLAQKASGQTKGTSSDKKTPPAMSDSDDKKVFYLSDKFGKVEALVTPDAVGPDKQGGPGDDGSQKTGTATLALPKTDFATMMQQNPSPKDAGAKTVDAGTLPVATRPHETDSIDAFDHAVSITKDGTSLAVQLDHSGLGKLDINLRLDKGTVNAQISVADDSTKKLIENNMPQIVHSLLGDGVSIGGFSVSLRQQGTGDGSNRYQQDDAQQSSRPAIQSVVAPSTTTARGLVNIFI